MGMTISVPVSKLKILDHKEVVEEHLYRNKGKAYTIGGLMVEAFGIKQGAIQNKPFSEWGEDKELGKLPSLYSSLRRILEKGVKEKWAIKVKQGSKYLYYWNPKITGRIKLD